MMTVNVILMMIFSAVDNDGILMMAVYLVAEVPTETLVVGEVMVVVLAMKAEV